MKAPKGRHEIAITGSRPMPAKTETLRWVGDHRGHLVLIDQTRLPVELVEIECPSVVVVSEAIKELRVRGAPAIGIAAAYGTVLGLQNARLLEISGFVRAVELVTGYLG